MRQFILFIKLIFYLAILVFTFISFQSFLSAEEVPYGVGSWDENSYGNHRAVVHVSEKVDAVWVRIPWRRRDYNPEDKNIIIIDAKTDERVRFVYHADINREFGDLIFQPATAPGDYYVYYMPYKRALGWGSYPDYDYPGPDLLLSSGQKFRYRTWLGRHGLTHERQSKKTWRTLPKAKVVGIQAVDEFNSFYPMEVIATAEEVDQLIAKYPEEAFLLFPEDRKFPIRMRDDLPLKWIKTGPQKTFRGEALRGEYYAFHIGVFASRESIEDIEVQFSYLKHSGSRRKIPASALNCFNTGGIDVRGQRFEKILPVKMGRVRPLWFGVQVPKDVPSGSYRGEVTIAPKGKLAGKITLILEVKKEVLQDAGDSEPWRHSRLRWLDSTIAVDDDIVPPYTPMEVEDKTISCFGRKVTIGGSGLPSSMQRLFSPEVTRIVGKGREILAHPVEMVVETKKHRRVPFKGSGTKIVKKARGAVAWESNSQADVLFMNCRAQMEFDGHIEFEITISASQPTKIEDIRLEIPISRGVAKYMMGMGREGGFRPSQHLWKWNEHRLQDSAWIGDVNAGVQCKLKGENYTNILSNVYSRFKDPDKPFINLPPAWYNDGEGGCVFFETDEKTFLLKAYSGPRTIEPGEKLHFNFTLLLTPFKTLDPNKHFGTRYFHNYRPVEEVIKVGANTINIHHARDINPYINYPFLRVKELKEYVDRVHEKDLKIKIYYTSRELTNRTTELWALKSLDYEVYAKGYGGGYPWLQEHFGSDYVPAWVVRRIKDAAIATGGNSRWHNYYLEGLKWIIENTGIDGLYLDDVDFDRHVMKRIRKVLNRSLGAEGLIDLHSCNHFMDRFGWGVCANLHLEHMPYIDSLWFGEYFDYDLSPDYWLVEVSGIPFGLMGEMLQDGGNPWRGMIYGSVTRRALPTEIWEVWDEVGIQKSEMIGYWSPACPVKTDHEDVLATAYVNKGKTLVSVASWAKKPVNCRLIIDWEALGLNPDKAKISAPAIKDFQDKAVFKPNDTIPIQPGRGWLFIISE